MMRIRRLTFLAVTLLAVSAALAPIDAPLGAQAKPTRERVDLSKLGPKVGERVPDFNLKDQTGTQRTLASIMGPKGALLVFYRSADW